MNLKEKQVIYVDNKPHIKAKVVMLSTNKEFEEETNTSIYLNYYSKKLILGWRNARSTKQIIQHLYIISDEEIKEGDWCINLAHKLVVKPTDVKWANSNSDNLKKIIATTDESLELPNISQQFIEKYIEEYNKGNQIVDVLIEVEPNYNKLGESIWELKVDSQNQITIRKEKDIWNREEVINLFNSFINPIANSQATMKFLERVKDEWIKENL